MDEELREICQRLLDYVGDLDEGSCIEVECPSSGDVEYPEIPSEMRVLLEEMRDILEET